MYLAARTVNAKLRMGRDPADVGGKTETAGGERCRRRVTVALGHRALV